MDRWTPKFEVRNPTNDMVIASAPLFGRAEIEQAITAPTEAMPAWAAKQRAALNDLSGCCRYWGKGHAIGLGKWLEYRPTDTPYRSFHSPFLFAIPAISSILQRFRSD